MKRLLLPSLVVFALLLVGVAKAQEPPAADPIWQLATVAENGTELPDRPGLRILEIGDAWVIGDEIVFRARIKEPPDAWALVSWNKGKLKTIISDGEEVTSAYAAPGMTEKLHVHGNTAWHMRSLFHGGRIGFLTVWHGKLGRTGSVYGWTGEKLIPVLRRGDVLKAGGTSYSVASAWVFTLGPDGRALLHVETAKPNATRMLVFHDGTSSVPIVRLDAPLAGTDIRPTNFCYAPLINLEQPQYPTATGGLVACLEARSTGTFLAHLTPESTTLLIGSGDPLPGKKEKIRMVELVHALGPDRYLAKLDGNMHECGGSKCTELIAPAAPGTTRTYIAYARLIASRPPLTLFTVRSSRDPSSYESNEYMSSHAGRTLAELYRFDTYLQDGTHAECLTEAWPARESQVDNIHVRLLNDPETPVILEERATVSLSNREQAKKGYTGRPIVERAWAVRLADRSLVPLGPLRTTPSRSVTYSDIVGYRTSAEAVAVTSTAIFLMKRP